MDLEKQRMAIAKIHGWEHNGPRLGGWIKPGDSSGNEYLKDAIPHYPKDLNAMNLVVRKWIHASKHPDPWSFLKSHLKAVAGGDFWIATAAEWAEALLKAEGLWEDELILVNSEMHS